MGLKTLLKRPTEDRPYTADFSKEPEIFAGDTILSSPAPAVAFTQADGPISTPPTVTNITVSADKKSVTGVFNGGTDGTTYLVAWTVTTLAGYVLVREGFLLVSTTRSEDDL